MAKIEERQLLITARLKDNSDAVTHGHGLPYPLPILNPVWVGMGDIIAAKANGQVEITIHNLDTPVILNDSLYNKLYEDIVKEAQEMEDAMYPEEELVEEEEGTAEEETTGSGESTEEAAETVESEEATEKKGKKNKKSKSE